ncbi:MAG TPA: hypothetical protein V6D50_03865 [Chroococcales cyanobacterium]
MTNQSDLEDVAAYNMRSLKKLERAIAMSQGQFSLILACCNCQPLRPQVVNQLQKSSSIPVETFTLPPSVNTLFTSMLVSLEPPLPPALMVFGLESVVAIDRVLSATNLMRDEFRKQFPFPVVLWINDEILQKLIRQAPDLKSWAANPIRFEVPKHKLLERIAISA